MVGLYVVLKRGYMEKNVSILLIAVLLNTFSSILPIVFTIGNGSFFVYTLNVL